MSGRPPARRRSCLKNVVENTSDPEDKDEDNMDSTTLPTVNGLRGKRRVSFTQHNEIKVFIKDSIDNTSSSIEESNMDMTQFIEVENVYPSQKFHDETFLVPDDVPDDRNADMSMTMTMKDMDDHVTHHEASFSPAEVENVCPSQKVQDTTFFIQTADMSITPTEPRITIPLSEFGKSPECEHRIVDMSMTTMEEPRFAIPFSKSSECEQVVQTADMSMTIVEELRNIIPVNQTSDCERRTAEMSMPTMEEPRFKIPFSKTSECKQIVQIVDMSMTTMEEPRIIFPVNQTSECAHRTADMSTTVTLKQPQHGMQHFYAPSSMQNSVNDADMSLTMDVESRRVRSLLKSEPITTPCEAGSKVRQSYKIKDVLSSPCSSSTSTEAKCNDQHKMFTVKVTDNETVNPNQGVPVKFVNRMQSSQNNSAFGKFGLLKTPKRHLPVDLISTFAGKVPRQESKGDIVSVNIQSNKQPVELQPVKACAVPAEVTLPTMVKPSAVPAEVILPTEVNACAVPTSSLLPSSTLSCIPLGDKIAALKVLRGLDRVEALKEFTRKLQPLSDAEFDMVINTITGFVHPAFIQAQLKLREYEKIISCAVFPTNPDDPALIFSKRIMRQIHAEEAR